MLRSLKYLLLCAPLFLVACQQEVDLKVPDNETELVVEGYLSDLDFYIPDGDINCAPGLTFSHDSIVFLASLASQFDIDSVATLTDYFPFNKVRLTTTSNYFSNGKSPVVSGAVVRLMENGNLVETLAEESPGVYTITHDPVVGASYHLEIEALDNFYETIPEPYLETPPLLSVDTNYLKNFITDSMAYYMEIYTYEKPGEGDHYRWMFYLNNEYVDDPFLLSFTDDRGVDGACIVGIDIYGETLELGDTLIVFQMRTSQRYYDFINSLRNQTAFVGSPFDSPPAAIRGNVRNVSTGRLAFGYFGPYAISANAMIVPEEIPEKYQ